jgi:hypothetical protein
MLVPDNVLFPDQIYVKETFAKHHDAVSETERRAASNYINETSSPEDVRIINAALERLGLKTIT